MRRRRIYTCIGCNEPRYLAVKNSLCSDCEELIKKGKFYEDIVANEKRKIVQFYVFKYSFRQIIVRDKSHNILKETKILPYVSSTDYEIHSGTLLQAIESLLRQCDRGEQEYSLIYESQGSSRGEQYYVYEDIAEANFNLVDNIAVITENLIKKGVADSKSIILSLNNGTITMEEFETGIKG